MKLGPGDIVEIETDKGFAYVQVTHIHPSYPEVVRSLGRKFQTRQTDLTALAHTAHGFVAILPLGPAIESGRMKAALAGKATIPETYRPFPTFRMAVRDRRGDVAYWWLWDGEGLRHVTELDEDSSDLPYREVTSIESFLARLD